MEPDSYYVAFSVNTGGLKHGDARWRPDSVVLSSGLGVERILSLSNYDQGAVFFFDLAKPELLMQRLVIRDANDDRENRFYFAGQTGTQVNLLPGVINYLGRLEVQDVTYREEQDNAERVPDTVSIVFTDRSAFDIESLRETYPVVNTAEIYTRNRPIWGELPYVPMVYNVTRSDPWFRQDRDRTLAAGVDPIP